MTVTVTFTGDTLNKAMQNAFNESSDYGRLCMAMGDELAEPLVSSKANGLSKEDTVLTKNGRAVDNKTVLSQALELLSEVYAAEDKAIKGVTPKEAVSALLVTYSVDNLREVPEEKASDLFSRAADLAAIYGVTI